VARVALFPARRLTLIASLGLFEPLKILEWLPPALNPKHEPKSRSSAPSAGAHEDEAALLGALLVLGDNRERLRKPLQVDAQDLRASQHRAVFVAIASLAKAGALPGHEEVIEELARAGTMSVEAAERAVSILLARAPRQPHVFEYARRVRARRA
jgi:DnaB helicase-like protein